jgi:hypothetical protein
VQWRVADDTSVLKVLEIGHARGREIRIERLELLGELIHHTAEVLAQRQAPSKCLAGMYLGSHGGSLGLQRQVSSMAPLFFTSIRCLREL